MSGIKIFTTIKNDNSFTLSLRSMQKNALMTIKEDQDRPSCFLHVEGEKVLRDVSLHEFRISLLINSLSQEALDLLQGKEGWVVLPAYHKQIDQHNILLTDVQPAVTGAVCFSQGETYENATLREVLEQVGINANISQITQTQNTLKKNNAHRPKQVLPSIIQIGDDLFEPSKITDFKDKNQQGYVGHGNPSLHTIQSWVIVNHPKHPAIFSRKREGSGVCEQIGKMVCIMQVNILIQLIKILKQSNYKKQPTGPILLNFIPKKQSKRQLQDQLKLLKHQCFRTYPASRYYDTWSLFQGMFCEYMQDCIGLLRILYELGEGGIDQFIEMIGGYIQDVASNQHGIEIIQTLFDISNRRQRLGLLELIGPHLADIITYLGAIKQARAIIDYITTEQQQECISWYFQQAITQVIITNKGCAYMKHVVDQFTCKNVSIITQGLLSRFKMFEELIQNGQAADFIKYVIESMIKRAEFNEDAKIMLAKMMKKMSDSEFHQTICHKLNSTTFMSLYILFTVAKKKKTIFEFQNPEVLQILKREHKKQIKKIKYIQKTNKLQDQSTPYDLDYSLD